MQAQTPLRERGQRLASSWSQSTLLTQLCASPPELQQPSHASSLPAHVHLFSALLLPLPSGPVTTATSPWQNSVDEQARLHLLLTTHMRGLHR
jgi:hypothetical protein